MFDKIRLILTPTYLLTGGVLFIFSVWGSINWAILYSTHNHVFAEIENLPHRPTAIVLGALVHPSGYPSDTLSDRLDAALSLYRSGKVKKILVSGGTRPPDYDEVRTMQSWLIERQVNRDDVLLYVHLRR